MSVHPWDDPLMEKAADMALAVRALTANLADGLRQRGFALSPPDVIQIWETVAEFLATWDKFRTEQAEMLKKQIEDLVNVLPGAPFIIRQAASVLPVPPAPATARPASPLDAPDPAPASRPGDTDPTAS